MFKKIAFAGLLLGAKLGFAATSEGFIFQQQAIAPACIAIFNDTMATTPFVASINLDACQKQHAADVKYTGGFAGYHSMYHNNDTTGAHGFYGYKVIGRTSPGVFVVHTYTTGGGSGSFTNLALLKLETVPQTAFSEGYTRLSYLGEIAGGDRCFDGITNVQLHGNTLSFSKYHGKTAVDCANPQAYVVDLEVS